MSIAQFPRQKRAVPKPPVAIVRESVTAEERAASDEFLRRAQALQRLYGSNWATPAVLATGPSLIAEAQAALDQLKELVGT